MLFSCFLCFRFWKLIEFFFFLSLSKLMPVTGLSCQNAKLPGTDIDNKGFTIVYNRHPAFEKLQSLSCAHAVDFASHAGCMKRVLACTCITCTPALVVKYLQPHPTSLFLTNVSKTSKKHKSASLGFGLGLDLHDILPICTGGTAYKKISPTSDGIFPNALQASYGL